MTATQPISPIRAALKALVAGVSGVSNVYDYQRHVESEAEVKSILGTGSLLHFWCVTLAADEKFVETRYPASHSKAVITFAIRGYMALKDSTATEKTFIDLVEDVMDGLRADKTLGGVCLQSGPARWVGPTHVSVANVLCHHAELIVPVLTAVEC